MSSCGRSRRLCWFNKRPTLLSCCFFLSFLLPVPLFPQAVRLSRSRQGQWHRTQSKPCTSLRLWRYSTVSAALSLFLRCANDWEWWSQALLEKIRHMTITDLNLPLTLSLATPHPTPCPPPPLSLIVSPSPWHLFHLIVWQHRMSALFISQYDGMQREKWNNTTEIPFCRLANYAFWHIANCPS